MKPILRWAGSKRSIANELVPLFPEKYDRYVEPFCGSASLFFIHEPEKALLGDINGDLINALQQMKSRAAAVSNICDFLPCLSDDYYLIRDIDPATLSKINRAARFLYLNRLCFNGLYRTNKSGKFNVPFSGFKTRPAIPVEEMIDAGRLLRRADIFQMDFETCISMRREGDFFYIDPPYASSTGQYFTDYHATPFSEGDISRLERSLRTLDSTGCKFMLSYANCDDVKKISKKWNSQVILTRRNISGFAGSRKFAEELVIKNY